jgi:hypothetical protein
MDAQDFIREVTGGRFNIMLRVTPIELGCFAECVNNLLISLHFARGQIEIGPSFARASDESRPGNRPPTTATPKVTRVPACLVFHAGPMRTFPGVGITQKGYGIDARRPARRGLEHTPRRSLPKWECSSPEAICVATLGLVSRRSHGPHMSGCPNSEQSLHLDFAVRFAGNNFSHASGDGMIPAAKHAARNDP